MTPDDIYVHGDINSRDAAKAARLNVAARRQYICEVIEAHPGEYSCYDFCEGFLKEVGHGGVSGTLNGLWENGLLWRVGRKPNGRGQNEWALSLSPELFGHTVDVDWDENLVDISTKWGLPHRINTFTNEVTDPNPPYMPKFVCQGCGAERHLDALDSKWGKPQLVGEIKGKRLMEARCPKCDLKPHKGMQAVWKEV